MESDSYFHLKQLKVCTYLGVFMKEKEMLKELFIYSYKALVFGVNYCVFAILFSFINNDLLRLGRISILTIFVYILTLILVLPIFRSFDIGSRKSKPVIFSTAVVYLLTLASMYGIQLIMAFRLDHFHIVLLHGLLILVPIFLAQIVLLYFFTYLGNRIYFTLYDSSPTLILYEDIEHLEKIRKYIVSHDKQYLLLDVIKNSESFTLDYSKYKSIYLIGVKSKTRLKVQDQCFFKSIDLFYTASVDDMLSGKTKSTVIDDVLMIESMAIKFTLLQLFMKRLIDVIFSLLLLILTSPIFLIIAIAIKLDDGGKVFFRQERVTKDHKIFKIIKFRSMKVDSGDKPATVGDSRITKVGHIVRKLRIDELPQLINILKGDMSVVGPRPESKNLVKKIETELPNFSYRLKVKAGLTGYAQIFGKYNTTSKQKLILDLKYIVNYSVGNDIKLILQTVNVFFNPDASTEGFED